MPTRGFEDSCDDAIVSAHIFSIDGRTWRSHPTPPYTSQVLMENGDNITLTLNASTGLTAYIEDYFLPQTSSHSTVEENIRWKVSYP